MDNLLAFLNSVGTSAALRSMDSVQLEQAMRKHGLSELQIRTILQGNVAEIAKMMKTSGDIVCLILPSEPDKQPDEDEEDKEEPADKIKAA